MRGPQRSFDPWEKGNARSVLARKRGHSWETFDASCMTQQRFQNVENSGYSCFHPEATKSGSSQSNHFTRSFGDLECEKDRCIFFLKYLGLFSRCPEIHI